MSELSLQQKRADMEACAPWIREALKATNQRAKELQEKLEQLSQASLALKHKLEEKQGEVDEWKDKYDRLREDSERFKDSSSATSSFIGANEGSSSSIAGALGSQQDVGALFAALPGGATATPSPDAGNATSPGDGTIVFADLGPRSAIPKVEAMLALMTPAVCAAIAAVLKTSELDDVTPHMYTMMESLGKGVELVKYAIDQEVEQQRDIQTLFRSNNLCSKMLKVFTARVGQSFVTAAIGRSIARVQSMEVLEIDPARVSQEVADRNLVKLQAECETLLNDIIAAVPFAPASMREVCNHIAKRVGAKFKDEKARVLGVGAYVILRVLGPPLLLGDSRTLILVSKVVQNLANQVLFGKKEVFMTPLNAVVKSHQERVNAFLMEIAQLDDKAPGDKVVPPDAAAVAAAAEALIAPALTAINSPALTEVHTVSVSVGRVQLATAMLRSALVPKALLNDELFSRADCVLGVLAFAADQTLSLAHLLDLYRTAEQVERFAKSVASLLGMEACAKVVAAVFSTHGKESVKTMVHAALAPVIQGNLRLEVEMQQLKSVDNVEANAASLITYCQKLMETTLAGLLQLPRALWSVLTVGPTDMLLVEGVLAPVLRDPVTFSIAPRAVKPECERTLYLLESLVRQLILGGQPRVDFPPAIRSFVELNQQAVQTFLREWSLLKPLNNAPLPISNRKADAVALRGLLQNAGPCLPALKGVGTNVPVSMSFRDALSLAK